MLLLIFEDVPSDTDRNDELGSSMEQEVDNIEDDEDLSTTQAEHRQWLNNTFLGPLKLSGQLSGFPNLHLLYGIFSCLPVSSASAERALSKLKIVKNRLRTSMSDDTLAALLVLASEKDLMMQLSTDDIIACLVREHPSLMMHLMY